MLKLTIITISLNNLEGLKRTCLSVWEQTARRSIQHIIIDGGSTDGTYNWLLENSLKIDHWISEPDKGIYNAMNKGILEAKGEYCLFLNSGDYLINNEIIKDTIPYLNGTDIVYSDQCLYDPQKNIYITGIYPSKLSSTHFLTKTLPHQATFIKTIIQKETLYTEQYKIAADFYFFLNQIVLKGVTTAKIPFPVSVYYLDGISTINMELTLSEHKKILEDSLSNILLEDIEQLKQYQELPCIGINKFLLRILKWMKKTKHKLCKQT